MKETPIEKELNPIISLIILIVVTVVVSIGVAVWVGSLTIGDTTKINFHAQIYSTNHNIGVLNEDAIFDILIENNSNVSKRFNIFVSSDETQVYTETVELIGLEKRNIVVNQKLLFTGSWEIKIFEENKLLGSHSFTTMANDVEAEKEITRIDTINSNNNLLSNILIIVISALILSVVIFWFLKKHNKKTV
ncbi:MAG: hypothetical protein P8X91_04700 [Candidatus Bathyarchaeota archaeon]